MNKSYFFPINRNSNQTGTNSESKYSLNIIKTLFSPDLGLGEQRDLRFSTKRNKKEAHLLP